MSTEANKPNYFEQLSQVNCQDHVEKKGRFTYLSWPFAISELCKRYPSSTWEVKRFNGVPYLQTDLGFFVEVAVTVEGITRSQIHPILNESNKPIAAPTTFQINTSIQRALVKAIALHGLGLYIYAGEDLPEISETAEELPRATPTAGVWESQSPENQKWLIELADQIAFLLTNNPPKAAELLQEKALDADEKVALWTRFDSKQRAELKKQLDALRVQK